MKKLIFLFSLFAMNLQVYSQNESYKEIDTTEKISYKHIDVSNEVKELNQFDNWMRSNWGFSLSAGSNLFYGDLRVYDLWPVKENHNERRSAFLFGFDKKLNDYIVWEFNLLHGSLSGTKRKYSDGSPANMYFEASINEYSTDLKFDLQNIFGENKFRKISLYSYAGIGLVDFRTIRRDLKTDELLNYYGYDYLGHPATPTRELVVPIGVGLDWKVSKPLTFNFDISMRIVNTDKLDGFESNTNNTLVQDMYGYSSIGFTYVFGMRDCDHDGVVNKDDICPGTPYGMPVDIKGCITDADGDGIIDTEDKCPTVVGTIATKGCPDTDGDGIADSEDECPMEKGILEFKGCPDSDGDGIADKMDKCPKEKGKKELNGCPDSDNDGIADWEDRCPQFAGSKDFNGCPDKDKDGIADIDDKCPDVFGISKNLGCPEVKKEVLKIFEKALTGIQFETGKDIIKPISYPILDQVVKAMKENPTYNLAINGHTDNVGDPVKNMELSKKRAAAVKKYLVNKGVEEKRMIENGYGDTIPVADNKTSAGRAKNRRVEFKVIFEIIETITE